MDVQAMAKEFTEKLWSAGDLSVLDRYLDPRCEVHDPAMEGKQWGPEPGKKQVQEFRQAFPDMQVSLETAFGSGDMMCMRWRSMGTHTGSFQGIEPTHKRVVIDGMTMNRLQNGKIVEIWNIYDTGSLMKQLGVMPEGPGVVPPAGPDQPRA